MCIIVFFVFNKEGKFQYQVSRYGQGANEYISMFDCIVDEANEDIHMLSIFGRIKQFSKDGICKQDIELPARPHYYSMELLGDKYTTLWSCLEPEEGGVLVIDRLTGDTIISDWHDDRMFDNQCYMPFHKYNGKVYFGTALRQQVYEVTTSGLIPAYLWDFGSDNIKESRLDYYLDIDNPNKKNNEIIDDLGTEIVTNNTVSYLYNIINTRINKKLPIIISTNLGAKEIKSMYHERITSRLFGEFTIVKFEGSDVRQKKLTKK